MATTKSSRTRSKTRAAPAARVSALLKDKLRTGGTIRVVGFGVLKVAKRGKKTKSSDVHIELVTSENGALRISRFFETKQTRPRSKVARKVKVPEPSGQEHAKQMAEIVDLVSNWAGGKKQALAWYRAAQIPEFGDRTAEALVKDGRATSVRAYIDHVALGGFA